MSLASWVLLTFIGVIIAFETLGSIYMASKGRFLRKLYHDLCGWHIPTDERNYHVGVRTKNKCRICGKEITQDRNGNWY
jgi:hypothetical protein